MPEKFNFFVFSSGRKEEGGAGIMFDNEDEKEQWEEDQKVSTKLSLLHASYISIFFLLSDYLTEITASWQRLVHDGWRLWWVPQPFHFHLWRLRKEERADTSEADSKKNICPETTDQWGTTILLQYLPKSELYTCMQWQIFCVSVYMTCHCMQVIFVCVHVF